MSLKERGIYMLNTIVNYISGIINVENEYMYLIILTILAYLTLKLIAFLMVKVYMRFNHNVRSNYLYNQKINIVYKVVFFITSFIIWENHLENIITLISFVSAATTIALREIIFNFFSGIYLNFAKPFKVEDRIEVNNFKGDVVKISALSFEILEVSTDETGEQSTGKTIHLPNTLVFTAPIKNYVKPFKYIWHEITVKVSIDSDLKKTKNIIYKIINNNNVIKQIPSKMKRQIDNADLEYRIYFNKYEPIIYTKVVDTHIELSVRFLMHPKKVRMVEDDIWTNILKAHKNEEIILYNS
jgi:small-conductance mechanosensitive channel